MFDDIPSPSFGLNFDPSHLDLAADRLRSRRSASSATGSSTSTPRTRGSTAPRSTQHGVLAYPKLWHTPKLPGLGDVDWGAFFGALADAGYDGPVCVEVEDRAYEGSLETRQESLVVSRRYLLQFIGG